MNLYALYFVHVCLYYQILNKDSDIRQIRPEGWETKQAREIIKESWRRDLKGKSMSELEIKTGRGQRVKERKWMEKKRR